MTIDERIQATRAKAWDATRSAHLGMSDRAFRQMWKSYDTMQRNLALAKKADEDGMIGDVWTFLPAAQRAANRVVAYSLGRPTREVQNRYNIDPNKSYTPYARRSN